MFNSVPINTFATTGDANGSWFITTSELLLFFLTQQLAAHLVVDLRPLLEFLILVMLEGADVPGTPYQSERYLGN